MARVLIVSFSVAPAPDRNGVELGQLVRALATRHQVDCLTVKAGELGYVERFHRARMLRVPVGPTEASPAERAQAFRRAMARQLDGAEYDVVHARDVIGGGLAIERARELGYKVVFEVTGEPDHDPALLERCQRGAQLVIAKTRAARNLLARAGLGERTCLVPPGCDIDLFDWESRVPGPPLIVALGRIAPTRGLRTLVRGFQAVRGALPDTRLLLVGPLAAGFDAPLGAALAQLGLAGHVDRIGPVDHAEVSRVIARSTVCVAADAPLESEAPMAPMPMKVLEYLACRRPVVAPRTPAIEDVVDDGESGLLFRHGDAADLANRVLTLLGDSRRAAKLAEAGYQKVRARYPASAARRGYLEAFARIVPPERPRDHTPTPVPAFALESSTARRHGLETTTDASLRRDFDDQQTSPSLDPLPAGATTITMHDAAEQTVITSAELLVPELPAPDLTATAIVLPPVPEPEPAPDPDPAPAADPDATGPRTKMIASVTTQEPAPPPAPTTDPGVQATPTPASATLSLAAQAEILRQAEFNEGTREKDDSSKGPSSNES